MRDKSYPKRIYRHESICCGSSGSAGSYWPEGEAGQTRLYNGLPMCWECASKVFECYREYDAKNQWKIVPSAYAKYVCDTIPSHSQQEQDFQQLCERRKHLDIVDTRHNVRIKSAEGIQPETFPQKGLKVNVLIEFDPEVFVPGTAVHVKMYGDTFKREGYTHLGDGVNGIIRGVQDGTMMCIAVFHPQSRDVYNIMVAASDYACGKVEITFLEKPGAKEGKTDEQ